MATEKQGTVGTSLIEISTLKPKQKFLNLQTGNMDEIEIVSSKFDVVAYDPKKHGADKAKFLHSVMVELQRLVQPIDKQIEALLKFAASESYQSGKEKSLAGGSYLTPETRSKIVTFLRMYPSFAEMSAKDVFDKWLEGYQSKDAKIKAKAQLVLDRATAADEFADLAS